MLADFDQTGLFEQHFDVARKKIARRNEIHSHPVWNKVFCGPHCKDNRVTFDPYQWSRSSAVSNHSADCYETVGSTEECW